MTFHLITNLTLLMWRHKPCWRRWPGRCLFWWAARSAPAWTWPWAVCCSVPACSGSLRGNSPSWQLIWAGGCGAWNCGATFAKPVRKKKYFCEKKKIIYFACLIFYENYFKNCDTGEKLHWFTVFYYLVLNLISWNFCIFKKV